MKKWRINLIFILIILVGGVIIGRLAYLQILQHDFYKALAQGQEQNYQLLKGNRGRVFLNGGQILATNIKEKYVFISPEKIKDKEKVINKLSEIVSINKDDILNKIEEDSLFIRVKEGITEEQEKKIKELGLEGVHISEDVFRRYPQEEMASQVIGFLGGEDEGQYGIEGYYDDYLQGKEKLNEESGITKYFSTNDSARGADIYLTIDYNIQFKAEEILKRAKEDLNIEGGQIIVMEPATGKILALANNPGFDPNKYSEVEDLQVFQNAAIQKLYEPGSVFKPVTMSAAIDQGAVTPTTTYIDTGRVDIGGYTIYNYDQRVWGERTMTEVLERSINTGVVFAESQLGHEAFTKYIEKFGIWEPTEIDLQGEIYSENKEFKKGYEINYATAAFGQGIEVTPIQMIRAFATIINGGKLVKPYIVDRIIEDGKVEKTEPEILEEAIISPNTASKVTAMLVSVVENGFGKRAKVPGYYIGGKTGTSQISWSALNENKTGYSDKTWQSFMGFAPAFNPRFLVLVKLNNPETKTAEYSAVPLFQDLAKYIIDYLQIPPDYEP